MRKSALAVMVFLWMAVSCGAVGVFGTIYETTPWGEMRPLEGARVDVLDIDRLLTQASDRSDVGTGSFSITESLPQDVYVIRAGRSGFVSYSGCAGLREAWGMPFTAGLAWDQTNPPPTIFDDASCIGYPIGPDSKAYSPDGTRYAREVSPGVIGVYDMQDHLLLSFEVDHNVGNSLKAMAWSRDSADLAVVYHGTYEPWLDYYGIKLYSAETGAFVRNITNDQPHYVVFGQDNAWVYSHNGGSSTGPDMVDGQYPSGITSNASMFKAWSGANLPWENYGWDVGRNPWGGAHGGFASNTPKLCDDFQFLAQNKVRLVRVWLFADLRSGIVFDGDGNPTGFDSYALRDVEVLLNAAEKCHVKLIPVLFDYMLADGVTIEPGLGEHPDLITDPVKRGALAAIFSELFERFRGHPAVYAWDVMNEPEYVSGSVPRADLKEFIRTFVDRIHSCGRRATLGCANRGSIADWKGLGLDIYQFHYYDGMESQYPFDFPAAQIGVNNLPVLIGECQPTNVTDKMNKAYANGYQGVMFWSLNANYDFRGVAAEYRAWIEGH